jgi:hypothetical protein
MARKPKLGSGKRFAKLKRNFAARRGKRKVSNPGALAAWIGRRKYGKGRFQKLAAKGRRRRK